MQERQLKNMRKNINKIQKMQGSKKKRKGHLKEENCQNGLWQESYLDGQIKGMMKNTRQGQKETRDDGKEEGQEGKEPQRQLRKKKTNQG